MDVLTVLLPALGYCRGTGLGHRVSSANSSHEATAAGGTPPLSYQWYDGTTALQDHNEYSGSATGTLTINPIGYGDAGSYTLVISNAAGTATSQVATLTVLGPSPAFLRWL